LPTYSSRRISKPWQKKLPRAQANSLQHERFFQALEDATRLRLLNLMGDQELCVCYFVEILKQAPAQDQPPPVLPTPRGIVETRREGKWMHYHITPPPTLGPRQAPVPDTGLLKQGRAMQADRARLARPAALRRSL